MVRCCLNHRDKHNPESWKYRVWYRNYILLILGVNTGNRIETLIELTPRDIAGGQYTCKEMKTGKVQQFNMNADVYATVREYIERYNIQMNEYIFESRQGLKGYPITRQQAWRVVKQLAKEAGIEYPVACHSLRKSYGRWYWDSTHDLLTTQKLLMHESAAETMLYIMLEPSDIQEVRESINHTEKWG
ncbi:tyrosine-type recombinase/integrase [uncultured Solobacterium sp.]|uniref:tyrosine-type recombinase/integrase n=1 Tax=uncultured Solobacterium sp. TaxID=747375 RepID=UPI0028DBA90C|nr:tyrosine-type recombinase/integrase [uncultured Solobacterium sp.]